MDPQRWEKIKDVFARALSIAPADRNLFLTTVCEGDPELRAEVDELLDHNRTNTFLDRRPLGLSSLLELNENVTFNCGETIANRFRIIRFIGSGGMGQVYEAEDFELRVRIALKTLRPEISLRPEALNRLKTEVQLARLVTHPNVCRIFDITRHRSNDRAESPGVDRLFLTMELLNGESLAERLRRAGPMTIEEAWPIVRQMGEALHAAHQAGVIHRDFKPSNVLLVNTQRHGPEELRPVVTDFGLARAADSVLTAEDEDFAGSGSMIGRFSGTPAYMSPEQIEGRPATAVSDIYAFGLVLYEMLTGGRPFESNSLASLPKRLLESPKPPRALMQNLSPAWDAVILRCLEREPANRFQSLQEVIAALGQGIGAPKQHPPSEPYPISRIRTSLPVLATVVVLLAMSVSGFYLWRADHNGPATTLRRLEYTRLTDFADSVVFPALSPDGRMLAMIRGNDPFGGIGDLYVKILPTGQVVQLTNDGYPKGSPVFSPDGSRIAFTRRVGWNWQTWTVPVSGGPPAELLSNASGLTWIGSHRVMFSEIGEHWWMKIVTASENRADERDVYRPPSDNMAHWSSLSPDSKWVLVVEMDNKGWLPCRVVPFAGAGRVKEVGPAGSQCSAAAWSPDGRWMYFSADVGSGYHIWRQRFPTGTPEQVTFGATEERGIAAAPDGRSIVTAVGSQQSTISLHTPDGDEQVSSERFAYRPSFSVDGKTLYYLVRDNSIRLSGRLASVELKSHHRKELLPGVAMDRYSISPDDEDVVFTRTDTDDSGIWIAPLSKRGAARQLTSSHADNPMFSRKGQILFVRLGGEANYVFSIKPDGTGLRRVIDDPVNSLINISPDGRWILVSRESGEHQSQQILLAYSLDGARPRVLCKSCSVGTLEVMAPPPISWSGDGKAIFVALGAEGTDSEGKTVIIPVNPLELFPRFFEYNSVRELLTSFLPGSKLLQHRLVFPGPNHDTYAVWKVNTQRNLYRISLQ